MFLSTDFGGGELMKSEKSIYGYALLTSADLSKHYSLTMSTLSSKKSTPAEHRTLAKILIRLLP